MSRIRADRYTNRLGTGAPLFANGVNVTGNVGVGTTVPTSKLSVIGDMNVTGTVSVGGTLSYEDVTSIDAVGIITAQSGIRVTGGSIGIGTASPIFKFQVDHADEDGILLKTANTAASFINFSDGDDNDVGQVSYDHATNHLAFRVNASERLRIDSSGRLGLGANNNSSYDSIAQNFLIADESSHAGMTIRSGGSGAFGAIHFADGTSDNNEKRAGRILYGHTGDFMSFSTANTERLRISSDGMLGINMTPSTSASSTYMLQMYNSGAQCFMSLGNGTSGNGPNNGLVIGNDANHAYVWNREATTIQFGTSDTERLRITSNGLVRVNDSATLSFGDNDDMRIFHDGGSANYIDVYNKDLYIRCNKDAGITGGDIILQPKSGENSAIFRDDGAAELYYDNSKKLETVSSGVMVTTRLFLGGSTNGGFDYNSTADTLEVLTTNGGTHSEWTSSAYVPGSNGGKDLGHHNKRWSVLYVNGIKFNGDTAAANMLDDYEEGTYTPYLMGSTGNPTYTVSTNRSQYVKIGRLVDVTIDMSINIGGQGSGDFFVTLPFIVENNGSKSYSELTSHRNNSWFTEGEYRLGGYTLQNTNQAYPRYMTSSNGNESAITWVTHTNGGNARIALRWMYYTAT